MAAPPDDSREILYLGLFLVAVFVLAIVAATVLGRVVAEAVLLQG